jgi:hypothetical protein
MFPLIIRFRPDVTAVDTVNLESNCVWIADVTPSTYPISVAETVPIEVVDGSTTVPVNVGEAVFALPCG